MPLRRLREHRGGNLESGETVRPFRYERATDPAAAITMVAASEESSFLAGGTNLVDLMKLEVATPGALVGRVRSAAQPGHGRREPAAAHPLRLLPGPDHAVQQARPRVGLLGARGIRPRRRHPR